MTDCKQLLGTIKWRKVVANKKYKWYTITSHAYIHVHSYYGIPFYCVEIQTKSTSKRSKYNGVCQKKVWTWESVERYIMDYQPEYYSPESRLTLSR